MSSVSEGEAFRSLVREYETLMGSVPSMPRAEFEPAAFSVLSRLYAAAVPLWFAHEASLDDSTEDDEAIAGAVPDVSESAEVKAELDVRIWLAEYELRHDALSTYLGDDGSPVQTGTSETDDESPGRRLAEDLISVLDDLKTAEAVVDDYGDQRDWAFGFFHWGDHAASALRVLFEFVVIESLGDSGPEARMGDSQV